MRNSLFKRYLVGSLSAVMASFLILGTLLTLFVINYWVDDKKLLLTNKTKEITQRISTYIDYKENVVKIKDTDDVNSVMGAFAQALSCDIYFCDLGGHIEFLSQTSDFDYNNQNISSEVMLSIKNNDFLHEGTLENFYKNDYIVAANPLIINDTKIGYCFAAINKSNINSFLFPIMSIFIYAAIATFVITIVLVWIYSYKLVRPLHEMSNTAKLFAQGDFTRRVKVTSEDELGELANAFNAMADSIASSEKMRRSFVANVSHELKTPMTTIGGFIDGILDGTIAEQKQREYLKTVSDEIRRLSRLVTSMLSLSRIDAGELKLKKQEFNFTPIIIQTLFTFEQIINKKNIDIRGLDNLPNLMIYGDADLLHQVIYNLFENASKFTEPGGYIEVRATETAKKTTISIINSGSGISPDNLNLIFDKFYKTDKSRNEDKKGMGLGLYIVQTVLRLHAGDIKVKSEINKYTDFSFWIPKPSPEQQRLVAIAELNEKLPSKEII